MSAKAFDLIGAGCGKHRFSEDLDISVYERRAEQAHFQICVSNRLEKELAAFGEGDSRMQTVSPPAEESQLVFGGGCVYRLAETAALATCDLIGTEHELFGVCLSGKRL
jgi:hypothetical protein